MASLLTGYAETGLTTAKFVRRRRSDGFFWSTIAVAFQVYASGSIANYGIAGTETGATGTYTATDPDDATEGDYLLVKAAGASLVVSDLTGGLRWQDHAGPYGSTVSDKTGFSLASTGLALVIPADPGTTLPVLGTTTLPAWIGFFGAFSVNEIDQTATQTKLRNTADSANLATFATSDDGAQFTSGAAT